MFAVATGWYLLEHKPVVLLVASLQTQYDRKK